MIYINLLPWREEKFKQQCKYFCLQLFSCLVLALTFSGAVWVKNIDKAESQHRQLERIIADNKDVLLQLETFRSEQLLFNSQLEEVEQINKLIARRKMVPQLLSLLQINKSSLNINKLSINHQGMEVQGSDVSSASSLALLNALRDESVFCQVTFTPFVEKESNSFFEFELQADLCDEKHN